MPPAIPSGQQPAEDVIQVNWLQGLYATVDQRGHSGGMEEQLFSVNMKLLPITEINH